MAKYVEPSGYFSKEMKKILDGGKNKTATKTTKTVKKTAPKKE